MNKAHTYGSMLRAERLRVGLPLWKLAAMVPQPQSNMHDIEKGVHEPKIRLAMRILNVLGVDVGNFMLELALREGLRAKPGEIRSKTSVVGRLRLQSPNIESIADQFGVLLRETRVAYGQSQKALAEMAQYTVRNLIAVENGKQTPKLMNALRLVNATGCDLALFFAELARLYREQEAKKLE